MPIDIDALLAADPIEWDSSWDADDVILYHLGIGAGVPATDPNELRYTYERGLAVLPTFGTVVGFMPIHNLQQLPGLDIDLRMLVHSDHHLRVHGPLPTSATARSYCRPRAVHDKRTGASVELEMTTEVAGQVLVTNIMTAFIKGEGGFDRGGSTGGGTPLGEQSDRGGSEGGGARRGNLGGGDPGPSASRIRPPRREPDATVRAPTFEQQALLYRLTGDANPLHVDPDFAASGGFERPILHGMCTFGMAAKAAVDHLLDGDGERISGYQARFSGAVLPGDTLTHQLWREAEGIILETRVADRAVLKQALITLA